jgi:UDP-glucose 4-epimerase
LHLLITGGAGFIGANLARLALDQGHDVTVIDNLSTGIEDRLSGLDIRFVEGSILDEAATAGSMEGVDSIIHLAALPNVPRSLKDPLASHAANATGTLHLLEQARANNVRHVVSASSSSVYGLNPALPKGEREWVRPISPYAVSKLAAEQYTLAYQQSFGMQTLAFRFFNVYGPGQLAGHAYAAVVPAFVDAILSGRPVPLQGDGSQSRDFTFVGTVCQALLAAAVRQVSHPEPVNLAFGTNTTLLDLLDVLREETGLEIEVEHLPARPGDVRHSQACNEQLRRLFPDLKPVALRQGVRDTVAWSRGRR